MTSDEYVAQRAMQFEEERRNGIGGLVVQVAGRLVTKQQSRVQDQGAGQRHALPLASGEFRRTMPQPGAESNLFQERDRTRIEVVAGAGHDVGMSTFSRTEHCGRR